MSDRAPTLQRLTRASRAELTALGALCLASKAHWGHDARFLAACEEELSFTSEDLSDHVAVIRSARGFSGVVQASLTGTVAELERLYVAPEAIGRGLGAMLMAWAEADLSSAGAQEMFITADPGAAGFYENRGAVLVGTAPSGSIPGRVLPRFRLALG